MKNTILALIATAGLLHASNAFALGHENEGVPLCGSAEYTCQNSDNTLVACVWANQVYVDVNGAGHFFPAQAAPAPKGIMGAGLTYEGNDLTLKIQTDAAYMPAGWPGYLNVPSLQLQGANLRCHLPVKN